MTKGLTVERMRLNGMLKNRKISFICFLSIIILALLTSCESNTIDRKKEFLKVPTNSINDVAPEPQELSIQKWCVDYPSIIKEYRRFVDYLLNEELERAIDENVFGTPDESLAYHWNCMQVETNIWSYRKFPKSREAFGYALEDLNGDDNNELILLLQDYTVLAIFTIYNQKPKLLDAFWPRYRCAIYDTGVIYTLGSSGAGDWEYSLCQIAKEGNSLFQLEQYGSTTERGKTEYYRVIDGKKDWISEAEMNKYYENCPLLDDANAKDITSNSGIQFIPLTD